MSGLSYVVALNIPIYPLLDDMCDWVRLNVHHLPDQRALCGTRFSWQPVLTLKAITDMFAPRRLWKGMKYQSTQQQNKCLITWRLSQDNVSKQRSRSHERSTYIQNLLSKGFLAPSKWDPASLPYLINLVIYTQRASFRIGDVSPKPAMQNVTPRLSLNAHHLRPIDCQQATAWKNHACPVCFAPK